MSSCFLVRLSGILTIIFWYEMAAGLFFTLAPFWVMLMDESSVKLTIWAERSPPSAASEAFKPPTPLGGCCDVRIDDVRLFEVFFQRASGHIRPSLPKGELLTYYIGSIGYATTPVLRLLITGFWLFWGSFGLIGCSIGFFSIRRSELALISSPFSSRQSWSDWWSSLLLLLFLFYY